MAGKQLGAAVRQFQRLFNVGTISGLTDDQLLARFVSQSDEPAFEALLERHGPMVLSVCRGVLKDPNDAQDAFQGTFLVLVRKARSIRTGASLGSWLYRVAFHMAIQINSEAVRRQQMEMRAGEMATQMNKRDDARGEDLVPALYEEMGRLPEKYRLPVVLCHLEELTHAQAAQQLGWTEGTVRGRVARAREVLRRRLARRGLALSAGAIASALGQRSASATTAAVPAAWIEGTVKAAMAVMAGQTIAAGVVSAPAVVISERMVRSLSMTPIKLTAASLLAAGAAAMVGAALVSGARDDAMRKGPGTAAPAAAATRAAKGAATTTGEKAQPDSVTGRVVDPAGRPVAGARIFITEPFDYFRKTPARAAVRAKTDADGRFAFQAGRAELRAPDLPRQRGTPVVVALADGFGPGFGLERDDKDGFAIRLARDDIPVEGRIVDMEGRPVAEARVQVVSILWSLADDLAPFLEVLRAHEGSYDAEDRFLKTWSSLTAGELVPATTTGADGRFTLKGIGHERIAAIRIEGPGIRSTIERVITRRDPTLRVPDFGPGSLSFPMTYYGARFDHVAEPSRPVVGVVRDKDTGKPIAGAIVRNTRSLGDSHRFIQTTTDAMGRYRLDGLMSSTVHNPRGDDVTAIAPDGEPYLPAVHSLIEPVASKTLTRDFALKRGIWITGLVIDKATRQPKRGVTVAHYLFKDNPHAAEAAAFGYNSRAAGTHTTAADGTFRLIGLPGRGLLGARADNEAYRMGVGAERIKEKRKFIDLETISLIPENIFVNNFHVLFEINPSEGIAPPPYELALEPGAIVKGRVLDPEGRPLAGAQLRGLTDWWDRWTDSLPTAEFEVKGLAPGDVRQLAFVHRERRLSGSLILRDKVQGPIEVKLQPWGTVTGRLIDANGQPRVGVDLGWPYNQKRRIEEGPGSLPERAKTDPDGRFRLEGLAPGLKYELQILGNGAFYGAVFRDLTIKAGETRDLGDVTNIDG
jgi:RNA polymerase sigma factor (sigma-70 family)